MTMIQEAVVEVRQPVLQRRWVEWGLLAGVLVLALGLRLPNLDRSIWFDECCSAQCATGRGLASRQMGEANGWLIVGQSPDLTRLDSNIPWTRIFSTLGNESHPPLYFVLLRFWMQLVGQDEMSMRILSLLIFFPGMILFWDSVRLMNGKGPALWAMSLLAVSHLLIWVSTEIRDYVLMLTLCLLAVNLVVRIEKFGLGIWKIVLLGLVSLAAVMSHYYSSLFLLGVAIYALIRLRGNARAATLAAFVGAAIIFMAVWGAKFHEQQQFVSRNLDWTNRHCASFKSLVYLTVRAGLLVPMQYLMNSNSEMPKASLLLAIPIGLSLFLLRKRKDLLLWQLLLLVPIVAVGIIDLVKNTAYLSAPKYTMPATAALCALLAGLLWQRGGWIRHLIPAMMVILCLATINLAKVPRTEWRWFGQELCRTVHEGDALIVAVQGDSKRWGGGDMYLPLSHYGRDLKAKVLVLGDSGPMSWNHAQELNQFKQVWAMTTDDYLAEPKIPGWKVELVKSYPFTAALWKVTPMLSREFAAPQK